MAASLGASTVSVFAMPNCAGVLDSRIAAEAPTKVECVRAAKERMLSDRIARDFNHKGRGSCSTVKIKKERIPPWAAGGDECSSED